MKQSLEKRIRPRVEKKNLRVYGTQSFITKFTTHRNILCREPD